MRSWTLVILAGLLSGTLLALSMPLAGWAGLGWVFLMPLLWATRSQGAFKGFIGGITAALFGGWVSTTPLIGAALVAEGTDAWNYVGFGLYGMVMACFVGWVAETRKHTWGSLIPLACLGVIVELITFIRLPAHIALSQYASAPMMVVASVGGIWAVSWLLRMANLTVLLPRKERRWGLAAAMACGLLSQLFVWSHLGQLSPQPLLAQRPSPAALLQTAQIGAEPLLKLQAPLAGLNPSFVVWPELSVGQHDADELAAFSRSPEGWPIVTSFLDGALPLPHNSAVLFGPQGASHPYYKRKPFGDESKMVQAGTAPVTVKVMPLDVGLNICFDSCYPWIMRDTVLAGADVIALPTLDPKSPNGFIQAAHAAFTTFRAAELGVPIIRAEHTAWSMVVNANGQIAGKAPVGWEGPMARDLSHAQRATPYRLFGDWFLWGSMAVFGVTLVGGVTRTRRSQARPGVGTMGRGHR
jgi:apolipoprotein N-acyltransferase